MTALLPSVEADSASQRPGVTLIQPQVVPEAGSGQPLEGRPRRSFSVERLRGLFGIVCLDALRGGRGVGGRVR